MPSFKWRRNNFPSISKIYVLALSSCMFFTPRASSLDEVWMLLHHYRSPTSVYVFILAFEAEEKKIMMEDCPEELVYNLVFYLKEVGYCWCLEKENYLLEGEALYWGLMDLDPQASWDCRLIVVGWIKENNFWNKHWFIRSSDWGMLYGVKWWDIEWGGI